MGVPAATLDEGAGHLGGKSLVGGIYKFDSSDPNVDITSTLTLTGGAGDTWIFQIPGNLTIATNQQIVMGGSAVPENVYWQVAGSTTISPGATFQGVILDYTNIAIQTGAKLIGRAFSQTAVTLDANTIVPVQAAATSVTISIPTGISTLTTHPSGTIGVQYTVFATTTSTDPVTITIGNGSATIATFSGTANESVAGSLNTSTVLINSNAQAGTYSVSVLVGSAPVATQNNSVIINTTAPIIPAPTAPTSATGWSTTSATIPNPLAFSISSASVTAAVTVSLNVNGAGYVPINSYLVPPITTTPIQSYIGYIEPGASGGTMTTGVGGSFMISIMAVDASGLSTTQQFGPFLLSSQGPIAQVSTSSGPGSMTGQVFSTGSVGTPISGTISILGAAGYYQIGLFTQGQGVGTPILLTGGFQQAVNNSYGTWSGTTYTINYPWTVPSNVRSTTCYIGIQGKDNVGNTGSWAYSANAFRIQDTIKPTVTINWPTSGSIHYSGSADNVTWTQTDNVPGNLTSTIWLTVNGVLNSYIPAIPQGQGIASTPWTVPLVSQTASNCVISENISDQENPPNVTTVSSNSFSIVVGQSPTVSSITSPACGVTWPIGSTQTITWAQNDTSSTSARLTDVIWLSADGGNTWSPILTLPNMPLTTNSQSIAVPDPSSLGFTPTSGSGSSATYSSLLKIVATNVSSGLSSTPYIMTCSFTITNTGVFPVQTSPTITLYPGWNLVSLPLVPTNSSLQNVLGNALPSITAIWTCSGGGTTGGTWSSWSPGLSYGLTTIVDGKAYWINTNLTTGQTATFTFQGRVGNPPPSAPPSYSYPAGWNMVGFTFSPSTGESVTSYLGQQNTTSANYNLPVIGYNANPAYTVGFTTLSGTTPNMNPGFGYWVFYNTAGTVNAAMQ